MKKQPLRILAQGYGLAAAAAAGCALLGAGWPGALLVFWLGGAGAVLGLAAWIGRGEAARASAAASAAAEDAALAEAARRWEADRLAGDADIGAVSGRRPGAA